MYSKITYFLKWLKYRITALNGKGHGVHSPFVYAFIREVLNNEMMYHEGAQYKADLNETGNLQYGLIDRDNFVSPKFKKLLSRMATHFAANQIIVVDEKINNAAALTYFQQIKPTLTADSILVFANIHQHKAKENGWEFIKADASVTITIDLFFMGIVFFRKQNLVKQHFIISF